MSNSYFTASGQPATGAFAASAPMRSEFSSIEDGFDLLPALTASTAVVVNSAGTALTNTTGTLALAGNFATVGAFAITLTATAGTAVTLPTTGTLATLAGAETLSNKTLVAPALGTPVSGVATNLTGTASGLTAGTVTTNANLSGPISSVGNTTSITAQTGTGTTFVMQTSPTLVTPALGTPTSGNLANCTALPVTALTGILATSKGGTGLDGSAAGNGRLLIGNGSGFSLATLTAGTNITITNGSGTITLAAPGSIDYSERDTETISGTPTSVVFTDIDAEDIVIYIENVAISSGTAQLTLELSINNGASYVSSAVDIGASNGLSTSGRYASVFITGAKIGIGQLMSSTSSSTLSLSGEPAVVPLGSGLLLNTFWLGAAVNAIRLATSASTFANGGVITLYGRG